MAKTQEKAKINPLIEETKADAALAAVWERRLANPLQSVRADVTVKVSAEDVKKTLARD